MPILQGKWFLDGPRQRQKSCLSVSIGDSQDLESN